MGAGSVLTGDRVADSAHPGMAGGTPYGGAAGAGAVKPSGRTQSTLYSRDVAVGKAMNPDPVTEAMQAFSAALNKDGANADSRDAAVGRPRAREKLNRPGFAGGSKL